MRHLRARWITARRGGWAAVRCAPGGGGEGRYRGGVATGQVSRLRVLIGTVVRDVRTALRGHDGWILTAGVTFYALLAAVPSLVVAVRIAAAVAGRGRVESLAAAVGRALPTAQTPAPIIAGFVHHAAAIHWRQTVIAVIPATVWGEGLRRGFGRVTPPSAGIAATAPPGRWEGWRSRLAVVPVLVLSPVGLLAVLGIAPELAHLFGEGGVGSSGIGHTVLAFYLALNVDWIIVSVVLVYVYRALGPRRPRWRPLLTGAFFTGAFISGFLQGFIVFLAIPSTSGPRSAVSTASERRSRSPCGCGCSPRCPSSATRSPSPSSNAGDR